MADAVVWEPDDSARARARLTQFLAFCGSTSFEHLYRRSIEDVTGFTERVLRFLQIPFDPPYREVLDLSRGLPWARWCVDGGLNIAHCLDRHLVTPLAEQPAVIWEGEEGSCRVLSYAELGAEVRRCAAGLRALGIQRGDAVALHLPMLPETVVALLAVARIGGIAVPLFSGYGPQAIETRLRDVKARALFTCDAFPRRGRPVPAKAAADQAARRCPEIKQVFVVRRGGGTTSFNTQRDMWWDDLLELGERGGDQDAAPTGAEDPLLVLYTSGTTGRPKGILHSHCGFPVKAAQDMALGTDVGAGDRILWVTDIGWMMGPWLIYGAVILGATMVLYDGAPDYPEAGQLWAVAGRHGVSVLGVSPTLVRALMAQEAAPTPAHDLSALRILGSTGEPWNPDPWRWLFERVGKAQVPIINYSGGTEISGGILMGNPLLPIKPCAFAAPCPGIAADVYDERGQPARGAVGELVITQPWIGMARGFWNDPERYLETYWSRWPGTWVHGDWARTDEDGHWYILGRSDDTLKVGGKRVGPAEVESVLVAHQEVAEAAVIGIPDEVHGTVMVAVCVLVDGVTPRPDLAEQLADRVAAELGKPFRPHRVVFAPALPRTRNAKVMRRLIRAAYLGEPLGDTSALENPEALDAIRAVRSEK
ncbi:MAG: AMP-binding protein [Gemmatimonadetes bacterium]|nr:AMP-binding protein [Gemmatimonadota bacterium]